MIANFCRRKTTKPVLFGPALSNHFSDIFLAKDGDASSGEIFQDLVHAVKTKLIFFSENTIRLMWLMWCCKPSNTSFSIRGHPLIVGLFTTLCLFKGELRIGKTFDLCDLDKS
jgi:hypothetical protein